MFGRIFGRGKDETDQAVCAQCGRTLLVGEWTQNVVGADGQEYLICSLCGQSAALADVEPVASGTTPANNGRVRESRSEIQAGPAYLDQPPADAYAAGADLEPDVPAAAVAAAVATGHELADERRDNDAFWRAIKEKDAEIERLQAELARMDAEKAELAGQLALARAQLGTRASQAAVPQQPLVPAAASLAFVAGAEAESPEAADTAGPPAAEGPAAALEQESAEPPRLDSSEPGERTWGETPAEFAAELAALRDEEAALQPAETAPVEPAAWAPAGAAVLAAAGAEQPAGPEPQAAPQALAAEAAAVPAIAFENTQPIPALTDEQIAVDAAAQTGGPPLEEAETTLTPETGSPLVAAAAFAAAPAPAAPVEPVAPLEAGAPQAPPEPTAAELEAEAANLTLLQRGVDLLNVSPVPHKIAETSDQLGIPMVNVGFDGRSTVVTFMWSMGWYRYDVDADSGAVRMGDRGYDERTDLRPNASVRADGTVQLAPAQISRAAKAPVGPEPELPLAPSAGPAPAAPAEPEPPSVAAQKAPEILSKSLLGQRSDDDVASWEQTQAREFDWNR